MNWWHLLHDYVKKNYENGRYNQNYNFSHSPTAAPRIAPPRHRAVIII